MKSLIETIKDLRIEIEKARSEGNEDLVDILSILLEDYLKNYASEKGKIDARIDSGVKPKDEVNIVNEIKNEAGIVSVGDFNKFESIQISQNKATKIENFPALAAELESILIKLKAKEFNTENLKAMTAISEAKDAAEKKDESGVMKALKGAGTFVLDIAKDVGAKIVTDLIKGSAGIP